MTTLQAHVEQEPSSQDSTFLSQQCLYCDEVYWTDHNESDNDLEDDDDDEYVMSLLSKEKDTHFSENHDHHQLKVDDEKSLMQARVEALEWMISVSGHHGFSAVTMVLGVTYFDSFILSVGYQSESPWMFQLAAVACLSLASKFEETFAPLLLQLQVDCKYIFEAKTIKRMELLILSTLEWKMNAVTPVSYLGILMKRFKLKSHHRWDILCRCESLILSAVADSRYLHYAPSVLAASAMAQTMKEFGLWNPTTHQSHNLDTLKLNKDKVEHCFKFIQEISSSKKAHKRKYCTSGDSSPSTVLDVGLSESSDESISSCLLSPDDQSVPKKCRTLESYC